LEIAYADLIIKNLNNQKSRYPILSLDRVYFPFADYFIDVTRITDLQTGKITIGERPGSISLEKQIEDLQGIGDICLADVGAFEGDTLIETIDILKRNGIFVKEIVLGYVGNVALNKLKVDTKYLETRNFYEWIELRDFFGIDGRNLRSLDGKRRFIPYWENLKKWASISDYDIEYARQLCLEFNSLLIGLLWREGYDLGRMGVPNKLTSLT
jgi:hypothetical protein